MRDDVMMRLVDHAIRDEGFRSAALQDPDGTLRSHGYDLEPDELQAVRDFHTEMAGKSSDEVASHMQSNMTAEGCG